MLANQLAGLEILDRHSTESDKAKSGKTMSLHIDGCLEVLQRRLRMLLAMDTMCFRPIIFNHDSGYWFLPDMEDEVASTGCSFGHVYTIMDRIRIWSICISLSRHAT